jgi:hypothetical protein
MREPDFEGTGGRAWRIAIRPEDRDHVDQEASLAAWHLNCPHAHPFWSWYMVTLIHLRDVPGMSKPATKQYPGASHEVIVMSLNPDHALTEPGQIQHPLYYLEPFDHVIQFDGTTDEQAIRVIELYVRACVDGHISPDQDYREAWKSMMRKTVEHVVTGGHSS